MRWYLRLLPTISKLKPILSCFSTVPRSELQLVIKTGPHLYLILLNVVFDGQDTEIEDVKGENQIFYKKCGILILDVLMTRLQMLRGSVYIEKPDIKQRRKIFTIFRIYSNPKFLSLIAMHQRPVVAFNQSLENTIGETSYQSASCQLYL